jgi:hypothetical protein
MDSSMAAASSCVVLNAMVACTRNKEGLSATDAANLTHAANTGS